MAHFLRGKQAGVQRDLSAGLDPQSFAIDEIARYGINSQVSTVAYDPTQSLLALGTNGTQYGSGVIYVFGQKRVSVTLKLPRKASVKILQFSADKLLAVDSKNDLSIFSLDTTRILTSYTPPGAITSLASDPVLDYAFLGLSNGELLAYDLDRQNLAPFRIPNLWREQNPQARMAPVVSLAFHPRDLGSLLIGYPEYAVIFSFQQNKPLKFLHHQNAVSTSGRGPRQPAVRLTQVVWHPTGTFVLTVHEDSTMVVWDPKDGRRVCTKALDALSDDPDGFSSAGRGDQSARTPITKVAWCAKDNPDDTGILIAGGLPPHSQSRGLTFLDLGPTPVYATSSWQVLSDHFMKPKKQLLLPTPPNAAVVEYCPIPRKSPHYAGALDPIAVIAVLSSGELVTMSFPSGHPITPTNQLHVSLTFVHPFVDHFDIGYVDRTQWLGFTEKRNQGLPLLRGGSEAKRSHTRSSYCNIIQTAHADGIIRLYDIGQGDEIENEDAIQVDVARAMGRYEEIDVQFMSISNATGELVVGLRSGEVAVFRWGRNEHFGRDVPHQEARAFGLDVIADRAEPSVKEGLLPQILFDGKRDPVTALKISDVGFICAGFEQGSIIVIDMRGPAVIFDSALSDLSGQASKRSSFRSAPRGNAQAGNERPTCIAFSVMSLENEDYSSILLFVGSSVGRVFTFKILPQPSGTYSVQFAGSTSLEDAIVDLMPLNIANGETAVASQEVVSGLRNGSRVDGVLVAVSGSGARIFRPATARGASKLWDNCICYKAGVARLQGQTSAFLGLFGDGTLKCFSLPGLKEISSIDLSGILDVRRFSDAVITSSGIVVGWTSPSQIAVLNVMGSGQDLTRSLDRLFNPEMLIPPRPTISNMQWITGTTHVTPADMDKLVGGPTRPPSKRMMEQMKADEQAKRMAARQNTAGSSSSSRPPDENQEGYWAYMQRQIQERTDNLGLTGDSMDKLEDNSQGFSSDVNKFIRNQKKAAVKGYLSSKMGF